MAAVRTVESLRRYFFPTVGAEDHYVHNRRIVLYGFQGIEVKGENERIVFNSEQVTASSAIESMVEVKYQPYKELIIHEARRFKTSCS